MSQTSRRIIALDARVTKRMSVGMRRYVTELQARLPAVAKDLRYTTFTAGGNFGPMEQAVLPLWALTRKAALMHHMSVYAPYFSPLPRIITIHDLIHLEFPEYFKGSVQPYYRNVVRHVAHAAVRVITDDERTVGLLERHFGISKRKIRVIPLGAGREFFDPVFNVPDRGPYGERPYIFYAGNHREHKNLETLFKAWQNLDDACPYDLVMTGDDTYPAQMVRVRANGARMSFLGAVDDSTLARLMHAAAALAYPSLAEGFGLPMLEALALGTTVMASDLAAPSVLRDWCTLIPARNVREWKAAIEGLRKATPQERLARRSYCRGFTWDHCAALTAACYREVLEERSSRRA